MQMNSKQDQKTESIAILGIILFISILSNILLVWSMVVRVPEYRIPNGDAHKGELAFAELNCTQCHTVDGVEQFSFVPLDAEVVVPLGGVVRRAKTYGDLVTAIIHPSESIRPDILKVYDMSDGQSLMPDFSDTMTTRQLMDLAAFLESRYEVKSPAYPHTYSPYGP